MLEQLYQGLYNDGHFTGSFEDFQGKMQDSEYRQKLHAGIVEDGDFTGDLAAFEKKYVGKTEGSQTTDVTAEPQTVSTGTESTSEDGSSESQEPTIKKLDFTDITYAATDEGEFGGLIPDITVSPYTHVDSVTEERLSLEDLINMDEDKFVKEFSQFGVTVDNTGFGPFGNRVKVQIPGQEDMSIDLKPIGVNVNKTRFETANAIKKLLDYRNSLDQNAKNTFTNLSVDDDYGNISQDKLDVFNAGEYKINRTQVGHSEMVGEMGTTVMEKPALYDVVKDGEIVFSGNHNEIKKYMVDNPQSDEGYSNIEDAQYDRSIKLYNDANEQAKKSEQYLNYTKEIAAKDYYENNLVNDVFNEFAIDPTFGNNFKDDANGEVLRHLKGSIESHFNVKKRSRTGEKYREDIIKTRRKDKIESFNAQDILKNAYKTLKRKGQFIGKDISRDDFVQQFLPYMENAWGNVFEETKYDPKGDVIYPGGLNKRIAKYKLDKLSEIKGTFIEKQMEEQGINEVVMSSIYAKNEELEQTKVDLQERSKFTLKKHTEDTDNLKKEVDNVFNEVQTWSKTNNADIKINYTEVANGSGFYTVESSDKDKQNYFQEKLNGVSSKANNLAKAYKNTQQKLTNEWQSWQASMDEKNKKLDVLESAARKDYEWNKILANDLSHSFENLMLDGVIFTTKALGLEETASAASNRKKQNQDYDATYLPKIGTWDENWNNGSFGFFAARTFTQNAAPLTTAVVGGFGSSLLFGSIRGANIARNIVPGFYGFTSAGGKLDELDTMIDLANDARKQLDALDELEKGLDPEDDMYNEKKKLYAEQRIALNQTIADGNISSRQKWGLSITTGFIEGGVTRYLGTVPNALKITREIKNPMADVIKFGTRNGFQNSMSSLGKLSWRVGGEVAEEEIIYIGSTFAEGKFLNKEMKYDQIDDVAFSSIIVAGPMNGPSIAYSSIMQHYATRDMYSTYSSVTQELEKLNQKFGFLNPNKKGYQNLSKQLGEERIELMEKLDGLNSEMEVMALLNVDKTGDLMIAGNQINELNKQANIDPTLSPEAQEEARKAYISTLSESEAKEYKSEYDTALKAKNKIINSIDLTNAVERLYGVEGNRVKDRL